MISVTSLQPAAAGSLQQEARHAPILPKGGPLHQESGGLNTEPTYVLNAAHSGPVGKQDSNSVAGSQRGQDIAPEALIQNGERAQLSARVRVARASREQRPAGAPLLLVRLTDGVAPVAQPGSAPQPELPVAEVARSNRAGGSGRRAA